MIRVDKKLVTVKLGKASMQIAILGTGTVGRTMATGLAKLRHTITIGTRDVAATLARTEVDATANLTFTEWLAQHPTVRLAAYSDAASASEIVVNATPGGVSLAVLRAAGSSNLAGKVLIDIANPLDFSRGFPPTLNPGNTDSLGEQIQRGFPAARVVKTLNTMTAALMIDPGQAGTGDHTVFISGNAAAAKETVMQLLATLGHDDIIDLGSIETARASEMLMPIWLRLWEALGTPLLNFKIIR